MTDPPQEQSLYLKKRLNLVYGLKNSFCCMGG